MGKLTWTHYGLMVLAVLTGFACSEKTRELKEVGTTQVEMRSDLVLPEKPDASNKLNSEENPNVPGEFANPVPATQRIALSGLKNDSQDAAYSEVNRYEFLPTVLKDSRTSKTIARKKSHDSDSWELAGKPLLRGGKGFGVGEIAYPGAVHPDDSSFYVPAVSLKPYSKPLEHLAPMDEPFKSRKPLVFHSKTTGFAHEPQADVLDERQSIVVESRLKLSLIPETQVYLSSRPTTQMNLAPAKNRLDLLNGNRNIIRDRFEKLP